MYVSYEAFMSCIEINLNRVLKLRISDLLQSQNAVQLHRLVLRVFNGRIQARPGLNKYGSGWIMAIT